MRFHQQFFRNEVEERHQPEDEKARDGRGGRRSKDVANPAPRGRRRAIAPETAITSTRDPKRTLALATSLAVQYADGLPYKKR